MSTNSENLNKAIEEIVNDKTFTVEAVEAIKKLRDENEDLKDKVENLNGQLLESEKTLRNYNNLINKLELKNKELDLVINDANEKATKFIELDKEAAVAKAESAIYNSCFDKVFRNMQIHESVTTPVPVTSHYANDGSSSVTNVEQHMSEKTTDKS